MKNTLLALVSVLLLSGCAIFKEPEKVTIIETKFISPKVPDSMLADCVADKPINKEAYLILTPVEREQYLTDYSIGLLGVINSCNGQLHGIKKILTETTQQ